MDKLLEIAEFYKKELEKKRFRLKAGKKGQILEFDIRFGAEHFKHLVGLQKLTDIPKLSLKSQRVYQNILQGQITYADISKSKYFYDISDRIDNFSQLKNILYAKELMIRSLKGYFNTIIADFMLTKKILRLGLRIYF